MNEAAERSWTRGRLAGILAIVGTLSGLVVLQATFGSVPSPGIICQVAVVYAALVGGTRIGLFGALALLAYMTAFGSADGPAQPNELARIAVLSVTMPGLALLVGILKERAMRDAARYEEQHRIATRFQRASLPSGLPVVPGVAIDAIYEPAMRDALVGGDWYDALRLPDGIVVFSIGDVCGHGLGAATTMTSLRHAIRGVAHVHAEPLLLLDAAERTLQAEHEDLLATAFVGVYDPIARTLAYASAGHPPPLLRERDGTVRELHASDPPLGARSLAPRSVHSVRLDVDALLVTYTDGLIEATRDILEGQDRLRRVVAELDARPERTALRIREAVVEGAAHDDLAVMTIAGVPFPTSDRGGPFTTWRFDGLDAEAAHGARLAFAEAMGAHGVVGDALGASELIFGELAGNVTRYAPGPVQIVVDWTQRLPVLHVLDEGPGFRHAARLPSNILSENGRGLFLVATLSLDFHVVPRPEGGSRATAVLPVNGRLR